MPRSGIMLCSPLRKDRIEKWLLQDGYVWVQPKLNGERCRAKLTDMVVGFSVHLLSSEANEIVSTPHLLPQIAALHKIVGHDVEFDGELYVHGMPKQTIRSLVGRTRTLHPDHTKVEYHIFDLVAPLVPQGDRLRLLHNTLGDLNLPNIKLVTAMVCTSMVDLNTILLEQMSRGYEGIVIRKSDCKWEAKRSTTIQKWKPRGSDTYLIIGTNEEIAINGDPKDALGSFTCISDTGESFNVGTGKILTRAGRNKLWKVRDSLVGKRLLVRYPELTNRKVPSQPVAFEII